MSAGIKAILPARSTSISKVSRSADASPTPIPWPELFTSFQTGVVEGSKNGITDIMGMKFTDAGLKYVTLDGHAYMGALWYMNNDRFMGMPDELRRVVVDGFAALQQATFASPKRKSIQAYEDFAAGGGDIYVPTPEEKQALKEAAAPVFDWFKANVDGGEEIFNAFKEEIADILEMVDFSIDNTSYQYEWDKSSHPAYHFKMSARDMAKFGALYQKNGTCSEAGDLTSQFGPDRAAGTRDQDPHGAAPLSASGGQLSVVDPHLQAGC